MLAILNGKLIIPKEKDGSNFEAVEGKALIIEDGRIKDIVPEAQLEKGAGTCGVWDAGGRYISPGFINIHIHGCFGADTMDDDEAAIPLMRKRLPSMGVTSFLPTTMTCTEEEIRRALTHIRANMKQNGPEYGAEVLGAYLEGPFISAAHKGSQEESNIRPAYFAMIEPFRDIVKYVVVAPEELHGDYSFVEECQREGIIVSMGHTSATYEEAVEAYSRGVRHVTHLYNAMSAFHHREPGAVGATFDKDFLTELIADGVHCHPASQSIAYRLKGDKLILITDSCRAAGLGDGESELGGHRVFVKDQVARLADGTIAAGVASMNRVVKQFSQATGLAIPRAVELATRTPAKELDCLNDRGIIKPGCLANLTVFDEELDIYATFVEGKLVYQA